MSIVPKFKIHTQLTLMVLLVVMISWILSNGTASYMAYHRLETLRQQMLRNPEIYPMPIPEFKFGWQDLLIGPDLNLRPPKDISHHDKPKPSFENENKPHPMDGFQKQSPPPGPPPNDWNRRMGNFLLLARSMIAMILALFVGFWLTRNLYQPLLKLLKGAEAFQTGKLDYRIKIKGDNEFTQIAGAMNGMAEQVSQQISQLEDQMKQQQRFLADVAHELRSPVTTMGTMAGALKDGHANDPQRHEHAINSMVRTSERLLHLVQDLLDLARLNVQELPIHRRKMDLRKLANDIVESHALAATQAGITLHPLEPGEPLTIFADPDRISQVLDNLIDNSISYAGKGAEITLTLEAGDPVYIHVSDSGKGIASKHIQHIFDAFYRADPARTPGDNHSGLGLRIARELIIAHGGNLNLSSEEGKGTSISITLPRESVSCA